MTTSCGGLSMSDTFQMGWYRRHIGKRKGHAYHIPTAMGPIDFGTVQRVFVGDRTPGRGSRKWLATIQVTVARTTAQSFDDCKEAMDWVVVKAIEQSMVWSEGDMSFFNDVTFGKNVLFLPWNP
jgi:hypothetical protein